MHDMKWIREEPQGLVTALARRGGHGDEARLAADLLVKKLIGLDEQRRAALTALEGLLARRNAASKEIGQAKAQKDEARAGALMAEVAKIKEDVPALEAEVKSVEQALEAELAAIPNVPLADVPDGKDEHENVERHRHGAPRGYAFNPKQHFEVGEALGQMDFETAAKLSGARFVVNKGPLARLERALGQFFLDTHTGEHGYMEVNPPILVRDETMFGTAQLPKFEDDQFFVDRVKDLDVRQMAAALDAFAAVSDERAEVYNTKNSRVIKAFEQYESARNYEPQDEGDAPPPNAVIQHFRALYIRERMAHYLGVPRALWLIPTAEVPLTNLVRESILSEEELPLRLTALTPCFRAEAGAAGRDTRGMIRQHQFSKVELVSITAPEKSAEEHERMLACAEAVLKKLELHYRVVTLCTGDMGFASQKTFDIEVWLPGQGAFREISSCSVCGDFQARRMNARYRPTDVKDGKAAPRFLHTLNGSGVAVGRALVAVLETYQQENGAVAVPEALLPYMGGLKVIEKLK